MYLLGLLLFVCGAVAFAEETLDVVEPEYLDALLKDKNYEEYAKVLGIENVKHVIPGYDNEANPMFNKELVEGDIMMTKEQSEQARQGIQFDRYPGSKWPGSPAQVPYTISNDFNSDNRNRITNAVNEWNRLNGCIKWYPRRNERNYVNFFPGNGCWSYLGNIQNGAQSLSLQQNGCMSQGTILHEMDHAAGFAHEHNRSDRDDHIEMLWDNIPDEWKDQYEKTNSRDFGLQGGYDYYSIMHYPVNAPGTNKPAFRVKRNGIDERRIGNGNAFTNEDLGKLRMQYC